MLKLIKEWRQVIPQRRSQRATAGVVSPPDSPRCQPVDVPGMIPKPQTISSSPAARAQYQGEGSEFELCNKYAPVWDVYGGDENDNDDENVQNEVMVEGVRRNTEEKGIG